MRWVNFYLFILQIMLPGGSMKCKLGVREANVNGIVHRGVCYMCT